MRKPFTYLFWICQLVANYMNERRWTNAHSSIMHGPTSAVPDSSTTAIPDGIVINGKFVEHSLWRTFHQNRVTRVQGEHK